jgi:uncharacterized membrane protein YqhA
MTDTGGPGHGGGSFFLSAVVRLRWLGAIAVVGSMIGGVLMFVVGTITTYEAVRGYIDHEPNEVQDRGLAATVEVIGALDEYLFGLLLLVFAVGICQLFLLKPGGRAAMRRAGLPAWLDVRDLLELKIMLVELILVVFIVQFLRLVLNEVEEFEWTLLTVPIAVGIFAIVLWVLRSGARATDD